MQPGEGKRPPGDKTTLAGMAHRENQGQGEEQSMQEQEADDLCKQATDRSCLQLGR